MSDNQCCVITEDKRCVNDAGTSIFTKRFEKIVQKSSFNAKMFIDKKAGHNRLCTFHKAYFNSYKSKKQSNSITDGPAPLEDLASGQGGRPIDMRNNNNISQGGGGGPNQGPQGPGSNPKNSGRGGTIGAASGAPQQHDMHESNVTVDFSALHTSSLKKYKRHFKLTTKGNLNNKAELIDAIQDHFYSIPVEPQSVITDFVAFVDKRQQQAIL